MLLNLATNAVEAMAPGGTLSVRAWGEADAVIVEIADTGPGIPPALEARIWEPFFTTKAEGTGLGLPIVRELVEADSPEEAVEKSTDSANWLDHQLYETHKPHCLGFQPTEAAEPA